MQNSVEKIEVKPYSKLAEIYDSIMNHVNYEQWALYIYEILKTQNIKSGDLIDISCGTGIFLKNFDSVNFRIFALDSSLDMAKSVKRKFDLPVICSDFRGICLKKKFDVVLCLYDSINYILNEKDFLITLTNISRILNPGGIFVFDISTETNSLKFFSNYKESGEAGIYSYSRTSEYIKSEHLQLNTFELFDIKNKIHYVEKHRQRIYSLDEVQSIINKSKMKILNIYDDFTFNKGNKYSERIHFVLKK
jgi:SAM-dependent methyltransferase